jgi:periplasmic protein CpxP/Spy
MRNAQRLTIAGAALAAALAATGLAAQDEKPAAPPQAPMMGQGQGMMPMMGMMREMSQMMETCNKMMQAHMAQPQQTPNKQ